MKTPLPKDTSPVLSVGIHLPLWRVIYSHPFLAKQYTLSFSHLQSELPYGNQSIYPLRYSLP